MKKRVIIIAVIVLIMDLVSKIIIDNLLNLEESINIINNFFRITKIYNDGASWNILTGHFLIIIIITILILISLIIYQTKFTKNKRNTWAFGLLYGGIFGNLLDRMIYGYVIDFLDFKIFGYNFPVFNFADITIVLGVILISIAIIKKEDGNEVTSG